MRNDRYFELHAALVPYLTDAEWAKRLSFGFGKYRDRSDANSELDPDSLTLLETQFQLSTRIGYGRESSDHESWALMQAREFGALLASVKKRVGPGFEPWVRAFCLFSPRTAARYMRIAREWGAKPVEQGRVTMQSAERSISETTAAESPGADARGGGV
jgi:hypothetical protein